MAVAAMMARSLRHYDVEKETVDAIRPAVVGSLAGAIGMDPLPIKLRILDVRAPPLLFIFLFYWFT